MQSEDRLIHFSSELIHPPMQHNRATLQKLYYDLSVGRVAPYDSCDFSNPVQTRFVSRRGPKAQSVCLLLPDRAVLIEEWVDIPLSSFVDKLREVGRRVLLDLNARMIHVQTVTLRTTFALSHFDDARRFLLDHVCGQADRIEPFFRRPIQTGGLRFVLPPTPEHPGALHVLIESYRHSLSEVYVETKGIFSEVKIDIENIERLAEHVQVTRRFIVENVFPYLDQYDTPKEDLV